jgi:3-oxoacyl-[acyl-carrier-protein] synthase-3
MSIVFGSRVVGWGSYLPANLVTNDDLAKRVDTSDEWITSRTGIKQRYIAADDQFTSHLAFEAGRAAIGKAGIAPEEIDLVIVATSTPDSTMPSTAAKVARMLKLGAASSESRGNFAGAFDMNAACSGFVYALSVADSMLKNAMGKYALVIGAETLSRIVDWEDRSTCVLFGDGAGAFVLERQSADSASSSGIIATRIHCDGNLADLIITSGGVSTTQTAGVMQMQGQEVFRNAVTKLSEDLIQTLAINGLTLEQLDFLVPHQANARILTKLAEKVGVPSAKVIVTVDRHANTSAASIPLAICAAIDDGRIKKGNLLALQGIGSGLTWATSLLKW